MPVCAKQGQPPVWILNVDGLMEQKMADLNKALAPLTHWCQFASVVAAGVLKRAEEEE
jgi:hypothetical protein